MWLERAHPVEIDSMGHTAKFRSPCLGPRTIAEESSTTPRGDTPLSMIE